MEKFKEYLTQRGKSRNTVNTYERNISLYLRWCRDSFGKEPEKLYRSNVLDYISYMRTLKKYSPRSVNNHLSSLLCYNEFLIQSGVQTELAILHTDFMKVQLQYASPSTVDKKDVEAFRQKLLESGSTFHELANQAGHSNIQTTLIYSNPTAKEMKEKANKL